MNENYKHPEFFTETLCFSCKKSIIYIPGYEIIDKPLNFLIYNSCEKSDSYIPGYECPNCRMVVCCGCYRKSHNRNILVDGWWNRVECSQQMDLTDEPGRIPLQEETDRTATKEVRQVIRGQGTGSEPT